jgi:transposase
MATTSFVYHTLGLEGYRHLRTEYRGGAVYHHVEQVRHRRRCRGCGSWWYDLTLDGAFEREFRGLPVGRRSQFVVLHGHEQACCRCGKRLREPIGFARGKRRVLKAFERYVVGLCHIATIKHVAQLLGVGWDLVKDIFKTHLRKRLRKRKWKKVRYIAVDEFAVQKGHRYMTVVLDLETGEILHAHEGKDAQALIPFLRKLKRYGARLQGVAIDMSEAYISAVKAVLPDVDIVHDPYHVVALANKAIDETRREMCRTLQGEELKVLKGSRFLLLKGLENLQESGLERLMNLMELNEPLYQAYLLKEDLRMFWNMPGVQEGESFLDAWIEQARATELEHFKRLAATVDRHRKRLLTYFKHRISTGPLEGLNNKIKVLKRQAYGFRDMDYFKLRLFFLHEATAAFPG